MSGKNIIVVLVFTWAGNCVVCLRLPIYVGMLKYNYSPFSK